MIAYQTHGILARSGEMSAASKVEPIVRHKIIRNVGGMPRWRTFRNDLLPWPTFTADRRRLGSESPTSARLMSAVISTSVA